MDNMLPEDCAKQWEILLLLIASEEKKIDRTNDSEIDTMNYFLQNEGVIQILSQWLRQMKSTYAKKRTESDTPLKCDDVSLWWRQQGNDKFRDNHVEESYKCYTNSVRYAYQDGPKYPLALANRSAALLRLKRLEECLSDIELAVSAGYPEELRYKLLLRQADCYIQINKREEALEALEAASRQALLQKLSESQAAELDKHLKILEKKLAMIRIQVPPPEPDVIPECYKGESPNFTAASSVLELRRSDTEGRHVVTRESLRRGDVVFSEEPYAWVALPSSLDVCDGCCATDINIVPCKWCSRNVYCSESCRSQAFSYHRWECVGAQADLFPTIGIAHLALRVLLTSTISGFPSVPKHCRQPATAADLFRSYASIDNIEIYNKDTPAFYRMFNLITNFDKMNNMDYIQYALTATMLTIYLEQFTSFFKEFATKVPGVLSNSQLRLFAAALLLRALGQLVCNGHAALSLALEDGDGSTMTEREVRRATAIYPSAAMMNHSCDPNIINTFYKARLIVRCSREVPTGGAVLNCYGPHKARDTTSRRRQLLRAQYLFTCSCAACLDMEHRDFVLLFKAYACPSCKGPIVRGVRRNTCPHCKAPFHLQKVADIIEEAQRLLAQADSATSLQQRIEKSHAAFRLQQQAWYRHNSALRISGDRLARLYVELGDFSKSVELVKQNIQSLEYQFGSFSVEVAHELRKLCDAMLERIIKCPNNPEYRDWCLETHKILKKAVQLMDLNYGSWEKAVKRLKEQETFVATLVAESRTPDATDNIHQTMHYNLKI